MCFSSLVLSRRSKILKKRPQTLKNPLTPIGSCRDLHFIAAQLLNGMRSFQDTADTYGPSRAEGRIVSFLKLYPNLFSLQGSGPNIKVLT